MLRQCSCHIMTSVSLLLASTCNNVRELFGILAKCGFTYCLNGIRGMLNDIMKDDTDTMHPAMNVVGKSSDTIKFLNLILFTIIYLKIIFLLLLGTPQVRLYEHCWSTVTTLILQLESSMKVCFKKLNFMKRL